jgi:hypothetical protein
LIGDHVSDIRFYEVPIENFAGEDHLLGHLRKEMNANEP